jgi:hypothetical protein
MATSEIEKLERRYAENPQGLTFAPLAEVHRKNGDVARALELLRAGLELHPNYIPASIVLGRCNWDLGDLPAAESAFAHVLRLDDENVIALKSLADINERLERFGEAQRWLHRLVSVDRSNEEAREQLARLEGVKDRTPRPAAPAPAPASTSELPHEIAAAESAPVESPPSPTAAAPPPPALEFLDTSVPAKNADQQAKSAEAQGSEPLAPEPPAPERLAGLSTHEFVPPQENAYRLHPELTHDFVAGKEAPLEGFDVETAEEVELQSSGASEFRVPNAAEDFMDLAAPVSEPTKPPPIAEGFIDLGAPAPEPTKSPPVLAEPAVVSRTSEPSKPSYSAHDTKGQSVASFFQVLLAARPPGGAKPPSSADPATLAQAGEAPPAQDGLPLSSGFGQGSQPSAPPVPAGGQLKDAAVSFDDFFSSSGGGSAPLSPGNSDPKNDDLDSFQSWLQNLKR